MNILTSLETSREILIICINLFDPYRLATKLRMQKHASLFIHAPVILSLIADKRTP